MSDRTASILIVDDDADICANMADILTDAGYRVDAADGGMTALEMVRRGNYDIALLDLQMPGMDGLTLYREIKKARPGTVVVIVTAHSSSEMADAALAAGAWDLLPKPVEFSRLLDIIDDAMDQPLVLVVDDDRDLCASLSDVLQEHRYRVSIAHDQKTAAEQLGESTGVVLIDMKLPGSDGATVFRWVQAANPLARTVLITGFRGELELLIEQLQAEGADAVCYKPFDVPKLLDLVKQLTQRRRQNNR
jgi:DNA-binding NtrC family response regulator